MKNMEYLLTVFDSFRAGIQNLIKRDIIKMCNILMTYKPIEIPTIHKINPREITRFVHSYSPYILLVKLCLYFESGEKISCVFW